MALPFLLWGAAALLAGTGVAKGIGAKKGFDTAKEIGITAQKNYEDAEASLAEFRDRTNRAFSNLGAVKLSVFNTQIKHLVEVIKKSKHATSKLRGFKVSITTNELKEMERLVVKSLEIEKGVSVGAATGVLAAMGAYSGVGTLAAASTGAAISGLSGVAATNATLAWLGGGALSTGGALSFGIYGGAIALGGIVMGPALAVGGFMLAGKAEVALTEAKAYQAKTEIAAAEMQALELSLTALQNNAKELASALKKMVKRFERVQVDDADDAETFEKMLIVGKGLKNLLDIAIMEEDGAAVDNITATIAGYAEV